MIIYIAKRGPDGVFLEVNDGDTVRSVSHESSLQIINHSPTGFEMGYGGSGPSQLALAILFNYTDDATVARTYYRTFKDKFIASARGDELILTSEEIDNFLEEARGM